MTNAVRTSRFPLGQVLGAVMLGIVSIGPLAGCSSEDGSVNCDLDSCTVKMDRSADAGSVSVLGSDVTLVSATQNQAVLKIAGQQITVPVDASSPVDVGGLGVTIDSITSDAVNLKIGKL